MGILSWIVIGLIAGMLGKFIVPGPDRGGILFTIVLGVVGALLGGWISTALGYGGVQGFDIRSLFIATLGAALLVIIVRMVLRGRG